MRCCVIFLPSDVRDTPEVILRGKRSESKIKEVIAGYTESCQTDEECGYPVYSCYEANVIEDVALKQCFVTWWFILILVLICLVVLICIIACIVACCCKICC